MRLREGLCESWRQHPQQVVGPGCGTGEEQDCSGSKGSLCSSTSQERPIDTIGRHFAAEVV